MDQKRKEELERKRQKLAELRKAREQRGSTTTAASPLNANNANSGGASPASSTPTVSRKHAEKANVDQLVDSLIGTPGQTNAPLPKEEEESQEIEAAKPKVTNEPTSPTKKQSSLSFSKTVVLDLNPRESIMYSKEAQTTQSNFEEEEQVAKSKETEVDEASVAKGEDSSHSQGQEQIAKENINDANNRDMSEEEKELILKSEPFSDFVEKSVKIVERVLLVQGESSIDPFLDYAQALMEVLSDEDDDDEEEEVEKVAADADPLSKPSRLGKRIDWKRKSNRRRKIGQVSRLFSDSFTRGRSVTSLDWSNRFPELLLVAYNRPSFASSFSASSLLGATSASNPSASLTGSDISSVEHSHNHNNHLMNDGLVLLWNVYLLERPEHILTCQSDVLVAIFHPFNPHLVIGGTYSGQVVLWDIRKGSSKGSSVPIAKSMLSTGHTQPIYSLKVVGNSQAHSLVSISTDGLACTWQIDRLAQPTSVLELSFARHSRTSEIAVTCMDFCCATDTSATPDDLDVFFVGSEEGSIYCGSRVDKAATRAGLVQNTFYRGHSGPVTSLSFHPFNSSLFFNSNVNENANANANANSNYSLFLSSSLDWSVKIWCKGGGGSANANSSSGGTAASSSLTVFEPILSLESGSDPVISDASWHPTRPNLLGSINGSGLFELWDLNQDQQVPIVTFDIGSGGGKSDSSSGKKGNLGGSVALTRIAWSKTGYPLNNSSAVEVKGAGSTSSAFSLMNNGNNSIEYAGQMVAIGGIDGSVSVLEISPELHGNGSRKEQLEDLKVFNETIKRYLS